MVGIISNPKKIFQVDRSLTEVKNAIKDLHLFTSQYTLFRSNDALNQYTYYFYEFLSAGIYIDINCFTVTDSRTKVILEVRRKTGTFNQRHDVIRANSHLSAIADFISESISMGAKARAAKIEELKIEEINKEEARLEKIRNGKQNTRVRSRTKPFITGAWFLALIIAVLYLVVRVTR
jgi:hypothetical protein